MHLWALSISLCQKCYSYSYSYSYAYSYSYLVALLLVHVVVVAERTLLSGENSIPTLQESSKKPNRCINAKVIKL